MLLTPDELRDQLALAIVPVILKKALDDANRLTKSQFDEAVVDGTADLADKITKELLAIRKGAQ